MGPSAVAMTLLLFRSFVILGIACDFTFFRRVRR